MERAINIVHEKKKFFPITKVEFRNILQLIYL